MTTSSIPSNPNTSYTLCTSCDYYPEDTLGDHAPQPFRCRMATIPKTRCAQGVWDGPIDYTRPTASECGPKVPSGQAEDTLSVTLRDVTTRPYCHLVPTLDCIRR